MKRKILSVIAVLLVAVFGFSFVACGDDNSKEPKPTAFVTVDINPSIELVLDGENKVMSIRGANEDAIVLLYGEDGIIGVDVQTAVGKIASLAVELGYLNEDNTVVQTSITGSLKDGDQLLKAINATITAEAGKHSLSVKCTGEAAYSALRRLEALKAQYPSSPAIQSLTPEKMKLAVAVSETGEISIEAAASMSTEELIKKASAIYTATETYATAAYQKAKAVASNVYDQAAAMAIDGIYYAYFVTHRPLESYVGVAYQGFKITERTLHGLAKVLAQLEKVREIPLNEKQIAAVKSALLLGDDLSAIENSNGEVTISSIEAYADKLFKNAHAEDIEAIKAQLTLALNDAEAIINEQIKLAKQEYAAEIEAVLKAINDAKGGLESVSILLPDSFKAMIDDYADLANKLAASVADGSITAAELYAIAEDAKVKASVAKVAIDLSLTDDDKAQIASLQEKATQSLSAAKAAMESAISNAEAQAKAHIEALKAARVK